jgi:preprotein translocase subunit SecD
MMTKLVRFNIYLWLAAGALLLATGCESDKEKKHPLSTLELHAEVGRDNGGDNEMVPILREHPIYVNVSKETFLDAADIVEANVVDDLGGFQIRLKFNWRGTQLLQSYSTAYRGKRIAVFCVWGPARWIAAPVIERPIADGILSFTPDTTREEADRIVKGLKNVVDDIKKEDKF